MTHFFFKDVSHAGHFDELDFCPISNRLEDGEVQRFGCVVEDGLLAGQKQHWAATHNT